ncbi:hypothetical protein BDZ89DRAFT_1142461 [Hymenopellis radicata]|nr:hypothetical protein BDZ89DRAFT_1142461 [Hymenopellis radicata]
MRHVLSHIRTLTLELILTCSKNVNDAESATPASGTSPQTNSNPATDSNPNDLFSSNTNITYASIEVDHESEGEPGKEHPPPLEQEPPPKYPPNAMALDTPIQPPRLTNAIAPSYTTSQRPDITNESIKTKSSTGAAISPLAANIARSGPANKSNLLPSVPEPPSMVEDQPTPKKSVATSAVSNAPSPPAVKPLFEPPNFLPSPEFPKLAMSTTLDDGRYHTVNYIAFFRITSPKSTITTEGGGCELDSWFSADANDYTRIASWSGSTSSRIVRTTPGVPITFNDRNATFFVIGRCTHSALFNDGSDDQRLRQISIQPIHRFTPRMVAVAATMLEFRNPIFAIERDGINFTTLSKPRTGKGSPNILRAEMNSVTHGDCPRQHDQDVPCFEGYDEDDFVLVAFSFNGYLEASPIANQPAAQRIGLSVRFTIRVAHVDDGDSDPTSSPLEASLRDETPLSVIGTHGVADQASGVAVKQELKKGRVM